MPSNEYYDSTGYPSNGAIGSAASMRAELDAIEAGFNKLPVMAANAGKLVAVNSGATGLETKTAAQVKTLLSLGNVDNTSDLGKPVSTATQSALDLLETHLEGQIANIDLSSVAFNDIIGGDVTKTGANELTIKPCSCWNSDRSAWLETTTSKTLAIPSSTANATYHIFIVRLVAGSVVEFRQYSTVAGPASDTDINAYRRIDYWITDGSKACRDGVTVNGVKWWSRFADNVLFSLTTPPANITTEVDLSAFIPDDFYSEVLFGAQGTAVTWCTAHISGVSGTVQAAITGVDYSTSSGQELEWGYPTATINGFIPIPSNAFYWGRGAGADGGQTVSLAVHAVVLRR